jgi:ligand-binding sensor domain-containing protein
MWFGTTDGLARYDGVNFYIYENNPDDKNSISHNAVHSLVEDASKNLWVGTSSGLNLYNREQDNFINFKTIPENTRPLNNEYISSLYADEAGRIWIGTLGNGLRHV